MGTYASPMTRLGAWVQASRPYAQIAIFVPLVYGEALAYAAFGAFRWDLFGLVHLFGLFLQLFVVFANDAADVQSDLRNTTYNRFSGGSRVVPERKLLPQTLAVGAFLALLATASVAVFLVFREHRAWMVVFTAIAAHLFWMYSFPPFRLSYRGYGEVLHGIGMGVLLPMIGFYVQASTLEGLHPKNLVPGFLLGVATNVTLGLADTPSDRDAGRRTFSVRNGELAARRVAVALIALSALGSPFALPGMPLGARIAPMIVAALVLARNVPILGRADSSDRPLCERFMATDFVAILAVFVAWATGLVLVR